MKKPTTVLLLLLFSALVWAPALLAQEAESPKPGPVANFIFAFLPIMMIGVILWFFLRKSQQTPFMQRSIQYYERSELHMQRMEEIGERIATALERTN